MTSRPATSDDIPALVALHAKGFETGWDEATIASFVQDNLVLVQGDPIIGFIIVRQTLDEAEIITLMVDRGARNIGVGLGLVQEALEALRAQGVDTVFLEVASDNHSAITLYHRAGFTQIGVRKAYYARRDSANIDALVLSKHLSPPANCS